jgi:hypothetical protein
MVHSEKDGQNLFHRVNDYYDVYPVKFAKRLLFHRVNLKYARLAETGIDREAENWHTKVQSTKYPNYSFVRMNLEDRDQLYLLFELNNVTAYPGMPGDYIPMVIGTAQSGASTDGRPTIF